MKKLKVLMIGIDSSVKGGMTSVINQFTNHNWEKQGIELNFIPTYIQTDFLSKLFFWERAYRRIRVELKKNKPDIVHIHMAHKGSFLRKYMIHILCKKYGVPDIIHLHGSEFKKWYDESDNKIKAKVKTLLKECNCFIVLGEKWNKIIQEIEPATKTLVVSNTVCVPEVSVHWNEPYKILFMGVLIQRKGVDDLLKAVQLLKNNKKFGNAQLIIAGTGAEEKALKKQSRDLQIDDIVEFVGWVDDKQKTELYSECQMLVLPSYNEGLPVAVLEAISFGMPVIASNVGDISAAVIDGENGYLIEPGNFRTLADKIAFILSNRTLWEKQSKKSKSIAYTKFSDSDYFLGIEQAYRSICK